MSTYTHWTEHNSWEGETWNLLISEDSCPLTADNLRRIKRDPRFRLFLQDYELSRGLSREQAEWVQLRYGTELGYLPATMWLEDPRHSLLEKPWEAVPQDPQDMELLLYKLAWYSPQGTEE